MRGGVEPERKRVVQRRILLITKRIWAECGDTVDYPSLSSEERSDIKMASKKWKKGMN